MKKLYLFIIMLFLTGTIFAQQLSWRFANPRILKVATYDNLQFDVQVKCNVAGTYYWSGQVILQFNTSVFEPASLTAWNVTKVGAFNGTNQEGGFKYNVVKGFGSVAGVPNIGISLLGDIAVSPYGPNPDDFAEIPTDWTTMITIRARLIDLSGNGIAAMDFVEIAMNGQQSYISAPDEYTNYTSPNIFDAKDFMTDYMGRFYSTTHGWSQIGNSTAAQWVNWNNIVSTTVWDGSAGITQSDNLAGLSTNLLIKDGATLTVGANKWLTVAGALTNAGTATNLVVEHNGSLIQPTAGVAATVNRNISAGEWHFISAPTSNVISDMFLGQYLQMFNEGSGQYTDIYELGVPLAPGKGYALWTDAPGYVASFAGPLNATATFPYTAGGSGWNLVGNPYASSLDWDLAKLGNPGLDDATYVHRTAAMWASYVSGASTNGGSKYIAPAQGFIVKATAPGSLAMNYNAQAHSSQSFWKNSEVVSNMVKLEISGNGYTDEAVVRFLPEATAEFDGSWDAYKFYGDVAEAAQLYTIGGDKLAINSLPETSIVPAGVHAGINGTYTIALTEMNDISEVTLEDTKTATFTDLTKGSYTFNYVAGENEQRFFLHFGTTGIGDNKATNVAIYSYQKTVYVNLLDNVEGDIFIYNIAGQLISTRPSAVGSNEIKLSNTGNYVVRVVTRDRTVVGKVFIQ
jgi:hypothetical protein